MAYRLIERVKILGLFLSYALASPVLAQDTDEDTCDSTLFPSQPEFRIATVAQSAQPKLYFFSDLYGCPWQGEECRSKAYVLPGDRLLLGRTRGEWTCARYQGKSHETVGWVHSRDLAVQAQTEPTAGDWRGNWKRHTSSSKIRITSRAGIWYVLGEAYWGSGVIPHYGELNDELKIRGRHAHVGAAMQNENYECGADLTRIGEFLVVHDNSNCGGVNVRFDGVYMRVR